jgi:hypothetical protein
VYAVVKAFAFLRALRASAVTRFDSRNSLS